MMNENVRYAVLIKGVWVGYLCNDLEEVEVAIRDYANDLEEDTWALEMQTSAITILPVIGEPLMKGVDFSLDVTKGDAEFEAISYEEQGEPEEFIVEDTNYRADSEYALQEYLKDLVRDGEYTVEEIRGFDIYATQTVSVEFEHAVEGELEASIALTLRGDQVLQRINKLLEPDMVIVEEPTPQPKPLSEMTDDELYTAHNEAFERMASITVETHARSKERAVQPYRVVTTAKLSEDGEIIEDEFADVLDDFK